MNKSLETLKSELHKAIVGQEKLLDRILITLLAHGHLLLEGVPGLGKTRCIKALCQCIDASMQRIQFTPDLLPSDVVGTEIYQPQTGTFSTRRGPLFTHFLLADEINRAPSKVQSALLQAMEERQVTIGERTYPLAEPFLVLATQNPIEQEGTYPLPEAQLDRFLMKFIVRYPSFDEELQMLSQCAEQAGIACQQVITIEELLALQKSVHAIHLDSRLDRYIVSLVHGTRDPQTFGMKGLVAWGASPRASIALRICGKAHALLHGKTYVTPDDIKAIAHDVLRHRIILSIDAEAQEIDTDSVITKLVDTIPIP